MSNNQSCACLRHFLWLSTICSTGTVPDCAYYYYLMFTGIRLCLSTYTVRYNVDVKLFTYRFKFSEYNTMVQYDPQAFYYTTSFTISQSVQYGLHPFFYYYVHKHWYSTVQWFLQFQHTLHLHTDIQPIWFSLCLCFISTSYDYNSQSPTMCPAYM